LASQINASNSGFGGIVSTGDSSGVLQLQTAGTTAVTIDTSQNVGIGTTSPAQLLEAKKDQAASTRIKVTNKTSSGSATAGLIFENSTSDVAYVQLWDSGTIGAFTAYGLNIEGTGSGGVNIGASNGSGDIRFATGGTTERMRIDSSGRVTTPFQPAFRAILGSSQTATFTGAYDLVLGNAVLNVGSCYNTSTGRFTAPVSGVYSLQTGIVATNSYGPNFLVSELKINGSVSYTWFTSSVYASGVESGLSAATTVYLNVNDYVQAIIYAQSSLTIGSAGGTWQQGRTYFSGYLVG